MPQCVGQAVLRHAGGNGGLLGRAQSRRDKILVRLQPANGAEPRDVYAPADIFERLERAPSPPPRIRALSPFDPLIRDRVRPERLFGFRYRIEVFVPAAKREYGYYVFPLLEGDRFIGRIDMVHDRRGSDDLVVKGLWLEPKVVMTKGRRSKIEAELERVRRFVNAAGISGFS